MAEISTPVNNSYQNTLPANLIDDLAADEDQPFSAFIRRELQKVVLQPGDAVVQNLLDFSKTLKTAR